jgi:hypothetical protein
VLLVLYLHIWLEWGCIKRAEVVALLKELGSEQLIHPSLVLIEQRCPDSYQLRIKGDYNFQEIEVFLEKRFLIEENKNYLIISSL